jgi:hypothetical protein
MPVCAESTVHRTGGRYSRPLGCTSLHLCSGDYIELSFCPLQVQVHIIEARELKAENLDGTSDPVVYVECFGQKQNTICIKQVRRRVLCPALLSIQAAEC